MLLLTGQRRDEIASTTWDELDMEKREWNLPGERTKNGMAHVVPLSGAVVELIEHRSAIQIATMYSPIALASGSTIIPSPR